MIRVWSISLSHNVRSKLGSVKHIMAMEYFLELWMALSAAFLR